LSTQDHLQKRGRDTLNGKRVNGRKRYIVTDTCGWLLAVRVTGAGVQDATPAACWCGSSAPCFPPSACVGRWRLRRKLVDYAATTPRLTWDSK
jgi:hypothetical protein